MYRYRTVLLVAVALAAGWGLARGGIRKPPVSQAAADALPVYSYEKVTLIQNVPGCDSPCSNVFVLTPHTVRQGDRSTYFHKPKPDAKLWSVHFGDVWIFCEQAPEPLSE